EFTERLGVLAPVLSLGKAYELGDLSVVYPLARSSPLFLFILSVVFLGEEVSKWGALGILLVVLGVYTLHLRGLSSAEFLTPLTSLRGRASQLALLTAFWTSLYSLIDKMGVTAVDPLQYAFWLDFFIAAFLTPVVLLRRGWSATVSEWRRSSLRVLVSGFLMRFGYVLVLLAMSLTQVSYILAVRQLSVVIGATLGVGLLGEKYGGVRLLGSLIIFMGVLILGTMT
ncbi:EamA family transporter, partial [Candidatus Bathyarchaeota archaeon]|nr:EamA family transporter [Candidatus Bathyarchaeota archaeon]